MTEEKKFYDIFDERTIRMLKEIKFSGEISGFFKAGAMKEIHINGDKLAMHLELKSDKPPRLSDISKWKKK